LLLIQLVTEFSPFSEAKLRLCSKRLCLGSTVNRIDAFHLQQHCLSVWVFVRKLFGSVCGVGETETDV